MWTPREIVKLMISRLGRAVMNFSIRFIFVDEETEAQNGYVTCTKWQNHINRVVGKEQRLNYVQVQLPGGRNTWVWVPALPFTYDFGLVIF